MIVRRDGLESLEVVHEYDIGLPGQLIQAIANDGNALTEITTGQTDALQHAPFFPGDAAQRRATVKPGALVEIPAVELQPLGEGIGAMGVGLHDFITIDRHLGPHQASTHKQRRAEQK